MDKNILIQLKNVDFSYDDESVLRNISFDVDKKGITLIYGENGSGKTSILKIISGLLCPSKGTISNLSKINIGFVFQKSILLRRTVKENLLHTLHAKNKLTHSESVEVIRKVLTKFNLINLIDKHVMKLSGGQQQMISFCRSIIMEPELLICDEPNNNLDDANKKLLYDFLEEYSKFNKVLIVSQDKDEISNICSSIYNIKDGTLNEVND